MGEIVHYVNHFQNGLYYNNTTIYAKTYIAHAEQVITIIKLAIKEIQFLLDTGIEPNFRLNHVRDKEGFYMQHCFLDIDHPAFFYSIIGTKHLGDHINYSEDPKYKQDIPVEDELTERVKKLCKENHGQPLVKLSEYILDNDQQKIAEEQPDLDLLKDGKGIILCTPALVKEPNMMRYNPFQLHVSGIPNDIGFISYLFDRYNRNSKKKIHINMMNRSALIRFEDWRDANFALCMTKRTKIRYNGYIYTISCCHSSVHKSS